MGQGYIVFLSHTAQIQNRIAHAAQSSIDAHSGKLGDFLETQILVIAHHKHFSLTLRQVHNNLTYIGAYL